MGWKRCSGVCILLLLLDLASGEGELMPSSGSGSEAGPIIPADPPTCESSSLRLNVGPFDGIIDSFLQLNCTVTEEGYEVSFKSAEVGLELLESEQSAVFGDYFNYDDSVQAFSLEVCAYDVLQTLEDTCSEELISVTVTIGRHGDRLLPFFGSFADGIVTNADDRAEAVFLPNPIPFWGSYYTSVYMSTNGAVAFGRPFTQYWPVTFPYGWSSVPIIAPYWNDLDFRNGITDSGLYYTTYVSSGTKRDQAFLHEFSERISDYTDDDTTFNPTWMLVATWYKATPYYGRVHKDETLTFQVLLASDSVDTYAVFLYEEGGINWNRDSRDIVIGYDSKDYVNYLNVNGSDSFTEIDSVPGNTGNSGEWYFQLTDPDSDLEPEQECFKWAARQKENTFEEYFEGLPSCPCTESQARRDWRFWFGWRWGLSSRSSCATLVWSGRQSTVECCYDEASGALLVEGNLGGSYKLHHPLFSNREYVTEDKQPYEHCCQSSKLCSVFYTYRPSDDCSGYDPSRISFTWGDPHFQTVDGLSYTFNGYGEYTLLQSDANNLTIQVRLALVDTNDTGISASVISAVMVVQGTAQQVQVEQQDSGTGFLLYVNGTLVDGPAAEESLIITESTTYESFSDFIAVNENLSSTEFISLRSSSFDLIISTSSGASVRIYRSASVLGLAVEVSDAFVEKTKGLLGYFNRDPSDDFYFPNGTTLSSDSSESDRFAYGREWHVSEEMSKFEYFDGNSYFTYNEGWDTHSPTFLGELDTSVLDNIEAVCGGVLECIFDYAITNNASFAAATYAVGVDNNETQSILDNIAPTITGPTVLYVTSGERFEETYTAEDADGHDITSFELVQSGSLTLEESGDTVLLVWDNPGSELPQTALHLLANDSIGATTLHAISIVLCACQNNGTCINTTTPLYDENGHFRQECLCQGFFSGELCENDDRGCSDGSCPESAVCVEDSSVDAGYNCSSCQDGYGLAEDGKCTDINECDTDYEHECMHTCNNMEGSYECLCDEGYELMDDGRNCTDIDECYEGTDDCGSEQMCRNINGSYECDCYYPEVPGSVSTCVLAVCTGCDSGVCAQVGSDQGVCICLEHGKYCVGDCNGTLTERTDGSQSCEDCMQNRYGYRCKKVCDCENDGRCDPVLGCVCHAGYTGNHCESEINEAAPEFATDTIKMLTLSWNLPEGAVLAQFNATDMDDGPPGEIQYSLYHGHQLPRSVSSGEGIFSINSETGILVLVEDLNVTLGLYTRFALTVLATDLGEDPQSTEAIVSITPEDTPAPIPSFGEGVYRVKISENVPGNSTILNFTCTEPEKATGASNLTTQLIESSDSQLFSLDGDYDDLMLVLLEMRDYEALQDTSTPHYTIEVTCSNQYDITTSATIEIEVVNEDDNRFEFDNSTYIVIVPENVPRYYHVLHVSAFDPDIPDGNIRYDAIQPGKFSIFPNGTVYVTDTVDREEQDKYTLGIEAQLLSSEEVTEAVVNITIADINEGPPLFSNDLYTSDNLTTAVEVGAVALVIAAVDRDFENNGSVVYSIEENPLFAINNLTGEVYINNASVVSLYGSYVLEVYASDEGSPPMNSTSRVDIYVAPIPHQIEFRSILLPISIHEDSHRGYEIETIVADVLDENGGIIIDSQTVGEVEYELIPTNDSENFHIGRYTGKLILLNSLDFERVKSYVLTISASVPHYSDAAIESVLETEVVVVDVNDNAPVFTPPFYTAVVEEFTKIGTSILTVHAEDADSGNNAIVAYRLADDEDVPFSVDSVNGIIEVTSSLNTPLDYRFYVVAEDSGVQPRSSKTVVYISVVRSLSVVPEFDRQQYVFSVRENSPPGTEIGTVLAQVAGNNSISEYTHLKYRLHSPDPGMMDASLLFHIDPDLGNVSVLTALDAEQQNRYIVYVQVHNDSHVFDNATIVLHVEDINDHAPEFRQSLYTEVITTAQPRHSILFRVSADDGDELGSKNSLIQYTIAESETIGFGINHTAGAVFVLNSTLYAGDYHLTAVATDGGDPHMTGTVLVFISVIPAGPQSILFEENEYLFDVGEDAEPGTSVGNVVALDHSRTPFAEGSDLRYSFSTATPTDFVHLTIGPMTGDILVSSSLDRENQSIYTLVVIAKYEGNQTGEVRMTVNVLDVNDNPPIFTKDVYAEGIFTNHTSSTAILQVTATDRDAGLNGTVRYSFSGGQTETDQFRITETGKIYSLTETIPAGDYRLIVTASDSNPTMPETSTAIVSICVIHQEPVGSLQITTTTFEIVENSPIGTEVGTVKLTAGGTMIVPEHYQDNLEFSIGDDYFIINPNNGTLKVVGSLDREDQSSYSIEVSAMFTDFNNIFVTETITINVVDVNDNSPLFNPLLYSAIIDDGYTDNQRVPTDEILVTDRDAGRNAELDLSIDELNPFGVHVIATSMGELRAEIIVHNASLLEPETSYLFNVIAADRGDSPKTAIAAVHVQVQYAIPEAISFPDAHYAFTYIENSETGTVVGNVSVLPDTPALDDLVYSVSGGSGLFVFHIDQYSGEISNHFPLDREQDDEFNLTISAHLVHQSNPLSATTTVTVTVLDTNDNIPIFNRSSYSAAVFIDELVTDVPLITVSANDADIGENSDISYSISPSDSFMILENGSIFALSISLGVRTYSLSVEATDKGDVPQTGSTIVLIDIRKSIPDAIAFSRAQYHFNVSEYNISGTTVGVVVLDPPLGTLGMEFVQYRSFSSDSEDFVVVTQSGVVQSRRQFDYETDETSIYFEVTCTLDLPHEDPRVTLSAMASVRVDILDENDNTPIFTDFPSLLEHRENVTQEEMIVHISAMDDDSGTNAELVFSIVNDVLLRINPSTGDLFVRPGLDREQQAVHTVSVLVSDRGREPNSIQADITLTLLDINDNIPVLVESSFSVNERISGLVVFQLQYRDSDEGEYGRATFSTISSDDRFSVHSASGAVTLIEELDFESEQNVQLHIELADNPNEPSNSNTPQYTVMVNVLDKPDNAPQFGNIEQTLAIDPGITEGDTLIQLRATDEDGDDITYSTETTADFLHIDPATGEITFTYSDTLAPGTNYEITVRATDDSEYELSSTIDLSIRIDARSLTFEHESYATSIPEDTEMNFRIEQVRVQELAKSDDYEYSFSHEVVSPQDAADHFRSWSGQFRIDIFLKDMVDRETVPYYILEITATRFLIMDPELIESAKVNLTVTLEDVNDNSPVISTPEPSYSIMENSAISTAVTKVAATDNDIGQNKELRYFILSPTTSPFAIDLNDGTIRVRQQPDFESQESYTLTIQVVDLGTPRLSSTAQYTIQVTNVNDRSPSFAAPAYFGELYTRAPANSDVKHVTLEISDRDGDSAFTFSISADSSDAAAADYTLSVSSQPPYHVIANRIPSNAQSGLKTFTIEVSDGLNKNQTILYLGVFAQEHLLSLTVSGRSKNDFLTVVDNVLGTLSTELSTPSAFGRPVSYYYESIDESSTDTTVLIMEVYGWFGGYGTRYNDGKEETRQLSNSVNYVTYDGVEEGKLSSAAAAVASATGIGIIVGDVPVSSPTADPPPAAPADNTALVGIASGSVVAILLIVLLIVSITVFGRRRKPKQRKDPYDNSYDGGRRFGKRPESFVLAQKGTSSDLAYETMYEEDDEMLNQPQTMPWFDPNYLASNENEYDGDGEQSSLKGGPLRATVDGDAKRARRNSAENTADGGSVMELDHSKYLDSYQQSTPMQPGQRMGEYDMFLNRNAPDADKPRRPSLDNMASINNRGVPANSRGIPANSRGIPGNSRGIGRTAKH